MEDGYGPPKLPPKSFKKKYIKAPLAAIKNALLKSKKQLQRQGSLSEHDSSPKMGSGLRRQHSMIEQRSSGRWRSPQSEFEYQQPQQYYDQRQRGYDDQYYDERGGYMNHSQLYDDYENKQRGYYEQENLYANRALIEFERKASENRIPYSTNTGTRIVRRHSMADRTSRAGARYPAQRPGQASADSPDDRIEREEIYQTRSGAFMMQQTNLPSNRGQPMNAASRGQQSRDDDGIYQHRREMHLDHLYQSKLEMQKRIHQGRVEVERTAHSESPSSSSTATTPVHSDHMSSPSRDIIYQSRRELKEKGFKTRTQLRDRIYQSRQEAMESMAEPTYSKRVEIQRHQEPIIYEGKESEHIDRTPEEESDRSVRSQPKNDSMNVTPKDPQIQRIANALIAPIIANQNSCNSSGLDEDDTVNSPNQSALQKTVVSPETVQSEEKTVPDEPKPIEDEATIQPPKPMIPLTRADPTHISNVMKRVAPMAKDPQPSNSDGAPSHENVLASRTSIETQYTSSQISLPTGPPVAQSTPYASAAALQNDTFYPPIREQTTTHGVFDENGGTLCDEVWNVSINIPKGAIPKGIKQEIYFTVTDPRMSQSVGGPPLDMENGWFIHSITRSFLLILSCVMRLFFTKIKTVCFVDVCFLFLYECCVCTCYARKIITILILENALLVEKPTMKIHRCTFFNFYFGGLSIVFFV